MFKLKNNFSKVILQVLIFDCIMTAVYMIFAYDKDEWMMALAKDSDKGFWKKLLNRFYYSVNVSTTIGLGPISPNTTKTVILTLINIYCTLAFLPYIL